MDCAANGNDTTAGYVTDLEYCDKARIRVNSLDVNSSS